MAGNKDGIERLRSFFRTFKTDLQSREDSASVRQFNRLSKRARIINEASKQAAISSFIESNSIAAKTVLELTDDEINSARNYLRHWLYSPVYHDVDIPLTSILTRWKFGPGASNGTKGTHFYDKIGGDWTVTSRTLPLLKVASKLNPYLCKSNFYKGITLVNGSKVTTVPKNEETDRLVCTEPLWNMAFQLSVGSHIEDGIARAGFDIKTQQFQNRALARSGSVDGTLCTIDLKAASDRITPQLVKALWPASYYWHFDLLRSEYTNINGVDHKLNMLSTMGNGFTFPMMTLTILSLLYAVRNSTTRCSYSLDKSITGVFGDDIICHTAEFDQVCSILTRAGLCVNIDKSFSTGSFRESCGGDYEKGVDITPFYVKTLDNDPEIYITINGLVDWSARTRVPVFRTLHYLYSLLDKPVFVPQWSDPFAGIRFNVVSRYYNEWYPVVNLAKVRLYDESHMLCLLNGSLSGSREVDFVSISRRCNTVNYKVRRSMLPKGFMDGTDYSDPNHNIKIRLIEILTAN